MRRSVNRILVIEDSAVMRLDICQFMRTAGYDVLEASNGTEGIELALRSPPGLILCDIIMDGIDGFGVLTRLRAEPATSQIPFVFITSSTRSEDTQVSSLLGADDYLIKPVSREQLLAVVTRHLTGV